MSDGPASDDSRLLASPPPTLAGPAYSVEGLVLPTILSAASDEMPLVNQDSTALFQPFQLSSPKAVTHKEEETEVIEQLIDMMEGGGTSVISGGPLVTQYDPIDTNETVTRLRRISHSQSPWNAPIAAAGGSDIHVETDQLAAEDSPLIYRRNKSVVDSPERLHGSSTSASKGNEQASSQPAREQKKSNRRKPPTPNVSHHRIATPMDVLRQTVHLEEDLTATFEGHTYSITRVLFYYLGILFTGGLLYLAARWSTRIYLFLQCVRCPLRKARVIAVTNSWNQKEVVQVIPVKSSVDFGPTMKVLSQEAGYGHSTVDEYLSDLNTLEYHCTRFVLDPYSGVFLENSLFPDHRLAYGTRAVEHGLNREDFLLRFILFGNNTIATPEKSIFQLLCDEVLHPFYLFQVCSIILWFFDDYYSYATCIFLMSLISVAVALKETRENLQRLHQMARFSCPVQVCRDGYWREISSSELVPGDVYAVTNDLPLIPCDSVLLSGDAIINESMLTGESVPVSKTAATDEDLRLMDRSAEANSRYYLFNGTKIIRCRAPAFSDMNESNDRHLPATALVARTGFNTIKGGLIRSMMFPKPNQFKFYQDSFKFLAVLALIASCGFSFTLYFMIIKNVEWHIIVVRALDLITVVIPPALPAAMSIGTSFAISRLKKGNIFCISPPRVNVCGKLSCIVFDKTGTLTEDGLDVLHVRSTDSAAQLFGPIHDTADHLPNNFLVAMTTCHSLKMIQGELLGDPMDLKMFQFTDWILEEPIEIGKGSLPTAVRPKSLSERTRDVNSSLLPDISEQYVGYDPKQINENEYGIIRVFEFSSVLRRMSVISKRLHTGEIISFSKGAPEVIASICDPNSLPLDFKQILSEYTQHGYRVLACSYKSLSDSNWLKVQKLAREDVECAMQFLGFIVYENKLKRGTEPALAVLNRSNIRCLMCTGDNVLTAVSVARECKLVDPQGSLFIADLIDSELGLSGAERIKWSCLDDGRLVLNPVSLHPSALSSRSSLADDAYNGSIKMTRSSFNSKYRDTVIDVEGSSLVERFELAITGDIFEYMMQNCPLDTVNRMLVKTAIFARMSPDQKLEVVERLHDLGYCVAMCGDGANDCGALKAADVGLSLSEAEASVAAPFTSRSTDIDCMIKVIREGRSALVTSFACFKFMALYSMIQFTSVTLLQLQISGLGDNQFLFIDLFLIIPLAIFMGRTEASEKLGAKRPTASLVSRKILIPLIGQIALQMAWQLAIYFNVGSQPFYVPPVEDTSEKNISNFENTVVFLLSNFQYITVAVVFSFGSVYRRPLLSNHSYLLALLVLTALCSYIVLYPDPWTSQVMELKPLPLYYRVELVVWAALHFVAAVICEFWLFPIVCGQFGKLLYSKESGGNGFLQRLGCSPLKKVRKEYKIINEQMKFK